MKYLFNILILILVIPALALGQVVIEKDVVASGGDHIGLASLQVSWTVGDVAVNHIVAGSLMVTEGFQQTMAAPATGLAEVEFPGEISVFPNPAGGFLHFAVKSNASMLVQGELWDLAGRKVADIAPFSIDPASEFSGNLDLRALPSGEYMLRFIVPSDNAVKTFGIVKMR